MNNERAQKRKHFLRKRILELMSFHDLTAQQLSFKSEVAIQNIYNIKNGRESTITTYEALLNAMGCTLTVRTLKDNNIQPEINFEELKDKLNERGTKN